MTVKNFFEALPAMMAIEDTFDSFRYGAVPPDWLVAVTDIRGSTEAIDAGRQKDVNFVGAAAIAALKNLCLPQTIPFQFGGDGAVILVPPVQAEAARVVLARLRRFVREAYRLHLRIGAVEMGVLAQAGAEVRLGRHAPSPGNDFAVFLGDGIERLEAALKGQGETDLARLSAIPESLDDGGDPDLGGLSCRWAPLSSRKGIMAALLVQGDVDQAQLYDELRRLAGEYGDLKAVTRDNLRLRWLPQSLRLEARARKIRGFAGFAALQVLASNFLVRLSLLLDRPIGWFRPGPYIEGIVLNNDFPKRDRTLALVFDCAEERVAAIRAYLDARQARGELAYGLQTADVALMTCLVTALSEDRHVHFVDGGSGGYAFAARQLKQNLRRRAELAAS